LTPWPRASEGEPPIALIDFGPELDAGWSSRAFLEIA